MSYKSSDSDYEGALAVAAAVAGGVVLAVGGAVVVAGKAAKYLSSRRTRPAGRGSDGHADALVVNFDAGGRPDPGVLKQMGYRVGRNGLGPARRRSILEKVYAAKLVATSTHPAAHIREWGEPNTRARAEKIERCLAGFIANARHKGADMSEAIGDWEDDLAWLRNRYRL
ncbi:hypothetical protein [Mycolicibacter sinensis]|uniref:hypothetical protein n=1 Tax=Mycolicibacter sinensis (strain JDM601) TaxID=875328 RepID=UPI001041D8BD|nr:hypothetical protein [Mycolicibacter sinensis]